MFRHCTKYGAKCATLVQLMHNFVQRSRVEIFAMNAPDPPYWTQTHVLGLFGPIHYCTNFGAKWPELVRLMHEFVQQNRVGMFCDVRTRSSPLVPEQMFWGVSDRFVTAQTSEQYVPH
jgi:hypothetical protein